MAAVLLALAPAFIVTPTHHAASLHPTIMARRAASANHRASMVAAEPSSATAAASSLLLAAESLAGELLREPTDVYYAFLTVCALGLFAYKTAAGLVADAKAEDDRVRDRVSKDQSSMMESFQQRRDET